MKSKYLRVVLLLMLGTTSALFAADQITLSPPPVSSDNISGKGQEGRLDINYMNYSATGFEFTGYGVTAGKRERDGNGKVTDVSVNFTILDGDAGSATLEGASFTVNGMFGTEMANKDSIFYVGPTLTYTTLTIDSPSSSFLTFSDTLTYGLSAGLQVEIPTGFGSFSPYFFGSYIMGSNSTDTGTTTVDTDIDPMLTTQLGFDMYFNSLGTSLSTMYRSDDAGELLTFAYSFKFK